MVKADSPSVEIQAISSVPTLKCTMNTYLEIRDATIQVLGPMEPHVADISHAVIATLWSTQKMKAHGFALAAVRVREY